MVVNRNRKPRLTRKQKFMAFLESWWSWAVFIPICFAIVVALIYKSGEDFNGDMKKMEAQAHETLTDERHAYEVKMAQDNAEQAARNAAIYAKEAKRCQRNH